MKRFRGVAILAATVSLACSCNFHASTGSGRAMAKHDLERGVEEVLTDWDVQTRSVKCDGDLPAKVGAEQTCWARMDDGSDLKMVGITTHIEGDDLRYDVEVDGKGAQKAHKIH
ncbi:DUF4333 domain-containing protein [Mycobacteroides abscessus]|uniref:DUF4333 domain-containing protein n=1 Tax=Mycobacteroides abscessus TaxID=36809 RepID=UPI0009A81F6D|nr:DUF4333 domain-containing protein [Mycobacteroides abscessus]SKK34769.1 Uncharacterised protein [Mycobacteroides abscessus subsp. massiliense]SKM33628.1 Uncharacterised protein [Mycobacteroides abscessus subsp. massiliense]SKP06952.1 Uncharacterised protein [Mycobacteroides abscessus subsp. massiliense]SKP93111.1 Uncharacterised protein [Mycobacteroides abscessus subsp. massiliense]SLK60530.1 Uncharacterised protein [Mycobacteroides abscessus subsp. massiliense]